MNAGLPSRSEKKAKGRTCAAASHRKTRNVIGYEEEMPGLEIPDSTAFSAPFDRRVRGSSIGRGTAPRSEGPEKAKKVKEHLGGLMGPGAVALRSGRGTARLLRLMALENRSGDLDPNRPVRHPA